MSLITAFEESLNEKEELARQARNEQAVEPKQGSGEASAALVGNSEKTSRTKSDVIEETGDTKNTEEVGERADLPVPTEELMDKRGMCFPFYRRCWN
uniref:Uncharacterized protein n=1 Tax=Parascaris equorum TaxID=6256 RepID=A0A914RWI0_PAREQ